MYYIERSPIDDATFLPGSVPEPDTGETVWAVGTHVVGSEVIRPTLHRVFRCAVARTGANTDPPEVDTDSWSDMRSTNRWIPFGPIKRADGKLVYESRALERTDADIEFRLRLRYGNAVALFGLAGAELSAELYPTSAAPDPVDVRTLKLKAPALGYWDYAYGRRRYRDRVLIHGLPIYPAAELRIKISGSTGQLRRVSQIEPGKLRYLPGVDLGGTDYGLRRSPRGYMYRKEEPDGSSTTLLFGSTYDMSGRIELSGRAEDGALAQFRNLLGKGSAFTPTLDPGYEQSLVFGTLEVADTVRETKNLSIVDFQIRGLPA